jgi:antibiotic biosynthesis monooxygenase (ABM) superfamily enzyme
LYPLQLLTYIALGTLTARWAVAVRLALFVPLVAASMTWLVMPRLAAMSAAWLYASPRRRRSRESRRLAGGPAGDSPPDR